MSKYSSKKVERLQYEAEKDLGHLFDRLDVIAKNTNKEGRKLVESQTKTTIGVYEDFLKNLNQPNSPNFVKDFEEYVANSELVNTGRNQVGAPQFGTSGDTYDLRKKFNEWREITNKVVPGTVVGEQAHQEMSVVGQRAFILYTALVQQQRALIEADADLFLISLGQTQAEVFRRLYISAYAVLNVPQALKGVSTLDDIDQAVDFFTKTTTQSEWELIKEKTINVLNGTAEQKLEVVLKQPEAQTKAEYEIGKMISLTYESGEGAHRINEILNNTSFTRLKGSKVYEDEVVTQLTDIATGKKPRPYRSATKKKRRQKASKALKGSKKLKQLKKKKSRIKIKSLAPRRIKKKGEKASEQEVVSLLRLKSLLNTRLPAAVRRNMGGAALTNRTGQFSSSVRLERIKQTPKGLSADYTYTKTGGGTGGKPRTGVYQVFEHPGSIHNNPNHDPRPLIIKSIRELALEYTDQKFTYLRRI